MSDTTSSKPAPFSGSVSSALYELEVDDDAMSLDSFTSAFEDACNQLRTFITSKTASASFSCGGTIMVQGTAGNQTVSDGNDTGCSRASPEKISGPINILWAVGSDSTARKPVLPVNNTTVESSASVLQQLVEDCQPATFGREQQDVLDPEYRRAGKMDTSHFATSFHPADFGILDYIERILLPSVNNTVEDTLAFRKLTAELYKLNVYSGLFGLFRKHVDTPRAQDQIGSLVVCLPSKFRGGALTVQHAGQKVEFDWSPLSDSTIQWAAFYSDCEHEIQTVTQGERITLTYNLYVKEAARLTAPSSILEPRSLPLYGLLRSFICDPEFMKNGGVLGFYCSHAYPHSQSYARIMLPRGLKGSDLALYLALKSLGIEVDILPVLANGPGSGDLVGGDLHSFEFSYDQVEDDDQLEDVINREWPAHRVHGIKWINGPSHDDMAFGYIAYGNEASI